MSTNKLREAGKRAFPKDTRTAPELVRPRLMIVPSPVSDHPAPKVEPSPAVKEMLREMNRKRSKVKESDVPDAA